MKEKQSETHFGRTLKCIMIRTVVDTMWAVMLTNPIYVWFLWDYRWLRPIILWYSPLTFFLLFFTIHFSITAILCPISGGSRPNALRPLFLKFQLFLLASFLKALHGTEVHGLRNLPKGGGLVVYYHAPFMPVDLIYLLSYVYLKLGRVIGGSIDRIWHKNLIMGPLVEFFEFTSGREEFIEGLKRGELKSVAPGGTYEAIFSKNYSVEWQSRIGFAKIAKETGAPVVPMFTANLQHSLPLIAFNRSDIMKKWYALIKRPVCIPKCYLPVKLRIYLGESLVCGKDETPEAFAQRVKKAIENLRDKYQKPDQTHWGALKERLC